MRWPIYAWGDGRSVHLWAREGEPTVGVMDPTMYEGFAGGIHMPQAEFDALVLLRMAQIIHDEKELRRAMKRAKKHRGNFGTDALWEALGEDPKAEFAARIAKAAQKRGAS
jgi:hypothetical protein